jgi:hypothetical protein
MAGGTALVSVLEGRVHQAADGASAKGRWWRWRVRIDAETLAGTLEKGTSEKEAERDEFRFRRKPL